mgnify:CR=1 FL=1
MCSSASGASEGIMLNVAFFFVQRGQSLHKEVVRIGTCLLELAALILAVGPSRFIACGQNLASVGLREVFSSLMIRAVRLELDQASL